MSNWNWSLNPVRYDPSRGYSLCEPCWNGRHIDPAWKDLATGVRHPKVYNCLINKHEGKGECGCGCKDPGPKKIKFTHEGQQEMFHG